MWSNEHGWTLGALLQMNKYWIHNCMNVNWKYWPSCLFRGTIFVESSKQKCQKELNIEKYCEMELCGINAMKIPYQHLELQVHRSHIEHQGWSWHLYLQVVMPTPNNAMHLLCFFYWLAHDIQDCWMQL